MQNALVRNKKYTKALKINNYDSKCAPAGGKKFIEVKLPKALSFLYSPHVINELKEEHTGALQFLNSRYIRVCVILLSMLQELT